MRVVAALALLMVCVSCRNLPDDHFDAAQALLARRDLLGTLVRLDRVPPADPRYPRARAISQALERRVRLSQNLLSEGLALRAEWRDREAVQCLEQAVEIWPDLDAAVRMLAATRYRMQWLDGELEAVDAPSGIVIETRPVAPEPSPEAVDPAVALQPAPLGETVSEGAREREIARQLELGLLESALTLAELSDRPLESSPLRDRLVEVLHQRALVHYGHGALDLALNDWARLLRLDPKHREGRQFADAARAELSLR